MRMLCRDCPDSGKDDRQHVVVEFQQDSSLIGGIVAKIGRRRFAGSVRRQLLNLRKL